MEFKFSLNHCIVGICLGFSLLTLASCTSPTDYSKGGTQDLAARYAPTLTAAAAHPDVISDDLKTAIPRASATAATIYSTRTALAQVVPTENLATRTAAEPILAELPLYQVNANDGYIA